MAVDIGSAIGHIDLDISMFISKLREAQTQAEETTKEMTKKVDENIKSVGTSMAKTGAVMTAAVTTPIVALGKKSIDASADFEKAMSQVQATMKKTKDDTEFLKNGLEVNVMQTLRDLALEMGSKTKFSSKEAADAINYLALAGYNVQEQMDALPVVLNLATAGEMDLASASDMVTDALSALGKNTEYATTLADQMAITASNSNTTVSMLGEAILTVGGTAKNLAGDTAELTGVLGILADSSIKGAEGGIHLRNIMLAMNPVTKDAKNAFDKLNLSAYDAQGNLRPLEDIFVDLNKGLSSMTMEEKQDIINKIFNKTDLAAVEALLGATAVSAETGMNRFEELGIAISGSAGAAQEMSDIMKDNLSGGMIELDSAINNLQIAFGDLLAPAVQKFIDLSKEVVAYVQNLSNEEKMQILQIAGIAAAIGPVLTITGSLITSITTIVGAFGKLNNIINVVKTVLPTLQVAIAGLNVPVLAIAAVVGTLTAAFIYLWNTNEEFREAITEIWNAIVGNITSFIEQAKEKLGSFGEDFGRIAELLKTIWEGVVSTLAPIFEGAFNAIKVILEAATGIILGLIDVFGGLLSGKWDRIWDGIKQILSSVLNAIGGLVSTAFGTIVKSIDKFIDGIADTIVKLAQSAIDVGRNVVHGLWEGISGAVSWLKKKISGFADTVMNGFKSAFGVHSPSTKMRDMIGKWLPLGIADGFDKSLPTAMKDMQDSLNVSLKKMRGNISVGEIGTAFSGEFGYNVSSGGINYDLLAEKMSGILRDSPVIVNTTVEMQDGDVILNGERVGKTIAPTISRVISTGMV